MGLKKAFLEGYRLGKKRAEFRNKIREVKKLINKMSYHLRMQVYHETQFKEILNSYPKAVIELEKILKENSFLKTDKSFLKLIELIYKEREFAEKVRNTYDTNIPEQEIKPLDIFLFVNKDGHA